MIGQSNRLAICCIRCQRVHNRLLLLLVILRDVEWRENIREPNRILRFVIPERHVASNIIAACLCLDRYVVVLQVLDRLRVGAVAQIQVLILRKLIEMRPLLILLIRHPVAPLKLFAV